MGDSSTLRWTGNAPVEIDNALIMSCTDGSESGKITDLGFHFRFVQRIDGLEPHAAHIRSLDLSSNNIRHMEGLGGMVRLRELKLYSCQITRIQNLEKCVQLAALHLEDNVIGAIEGLDNCKCLEYLNLDRNQIQKVGAGLAKLSKLKELHLSKNQLASLHGVAGCAALEVLHANGNGIAEVTAVSLKGLGRLDELRLAENRLQNLEFLTIRNAGGSSQLAVPCVATLDVSGNRLNTEALRNIPALPQLLELSIANNLLGAIPDGLAPKLAALEIFDIGGNCLERPEDLERLKEISSLRELVVRDNKFADAAALGLALKALTGLEYVDEAEVERPVGDPDTDEEAGFQDKMGDTFHLTNSKAKPGLAGISASPLRPGTGGSRPGTGSSRPASAQSMQQAGVRDPLMCTPLKVTGKRYASEETILQWEQQTLSTFTAIERQMQKTFEQGDSDLQDMNRYFEKMEKLLQRERDRKMREKAGAAPRASGLETHEEEDLEAEVDAMLDESRPTSRARSRLNWAVDFGQEHLPEDMPLPVSPGTASALGRPSASEPLPAACDEEIEAEEPDEDSRQPELSVVEDDDSVEEGEDEEPAMAAASAGPAHAAARPPLLAGTGGRSPPTSSGGRAELHVRERSGSRQRRTAPTGAQPRNRSNGRRPG